MKLDSINKPRVNGATFPLTFPPTLPPGLSLVCLLLSLLFSVAAFSQDSSSHEHQNLSSPFGLQAISDLSLNFALVGSTGDLVRRSDFLGKNVLVAFGFTYCPDVCPVIAANMANALKHTEKEAIGIFISVDTERDTPEVSDSYARRFGARMIGLSGSHDQVSEAAKNFNVTFVVTKTPDSYRVAHSPGTFLISPEGTLIDVFAINADPKEIAAAMQ